ncbi:PadR family transcriptional regulator [Hoyosella rhizosphaerae]|uniref:PadR family transcriptional regulator n=1 Tax=Hoyosella rhizosphaerae TaxID=1755582 RepID=A0A916XH04_9ACTN|nr:PadR family transcriptional regulator [Hoyosella rhizosphaerae]MBN4928142.1 PadR family transcriptional regulator [Hoyosella rhizosphaerae]GGC72722.1 PadR family transcriptional regulator [Hoyosella rhizosphaerae]
MSLEHAILISLQERAGSGYELARRFDRSIGYFWTASHQQIYRTLKRMAESNWVVGEQIPQDDRPDKTVYRPSAEGLEALRAWISEPVNGTNFRSVLAVKLRGASYGDTTALACEFKRHRTLAEQRLHTYHHIENRDFAHAPSLTGTPLHQHLVLRAGIIEAQSFLAWCDEVLTALDSTPRQA